MAVTGTITITTLLFLYVARVRWHAPLWLVIGGGGALLTVDLLFLAANLTKLMHGAWLPLLIGLLAFTVLTTWQHGERIVNEARSRAAGSLRDFVSGLAERTPPLPRLPGTAVFLNPGSASTPMAMRANVDNFHALHRTVLIVSVETVPVPRVPEADRITADNLGRIGDGILAVSARFGYMERPDVPAALRLLDPAVTEVALDLDHASYFLSRVEVVAGPEPTMAAFRKRLYIAITHMKADAAGYYRLPPERTVIIGSQFAV